MSTKPNKRPIVALAMTVALAGCSASTSLQTPTIPPVGSSAPPTSIPPIVAPPTIPPTQPAPDNPTALPTTSTTSTSTTVVVADPDPVPDPNPPRVEPEPGVRYDLGDTAQLGPEPVRGSGCGADGSIGDVIPDGLWYGWISDWDPPTFAFDLVCVYYGDSAVPHRDACYEGSESNLDVCLNQELDYWVVNNNSRTRPVRISASVDIYNSQPDACPGYQLWDGSAVSLIQIYDGEAIYVRWACGGS